MPALAWNQTFPSKTRCISQPLDTSQEFDLQRNPLAGERLQALAEKGLIWTAEALPGFSPVVSNALAATASESDPLEAGMRAAQLFADNFLDAGLHEVWFDSAASSAPSILPTFFALQALKRTLPLAQLEASAQRAEGFVSRSISPRSIFLPSIFWLGRECWPTPFVLQELFEDMFGLGEFSASKKQALLHALFSRCLFVDLANDSVQDAAVFQNKASQNTVSQNTVVRRERSLWALDAVLRSASAAAIVADLDQVPFPVTRRFALALKQAQTLLLILRNRSLLRREFASVNLPQSAAKGRWFLNWQPCSYEQIPTQASAWRLELLQYKGPLSLAREELTGQKFLECSLSENQILACRLAYQRGTVFLQTLKH